MVEAQRSVLTYRQAAGVKLNCTIDLAQLFSGQEDRKGFDRRFKEFCNSQPTICNIIQESQTKLKYKSEQLIPLKRDNRPSVLFVFGNPAIHSIDKGMFFTSEGKTPREHRFWRSILPAAGINDFNFDGLSKGQRNAKRRRAFLELDYKAPVTIGLCVFISFPSTASGNYSGIQGVKRLFGSKAMAELVKYEKERVYAVINEFVSYDGAVFTFQSDAWNGLKGDEDSAYDISKAKTGQLNGTVAGMPRIRLFGLPPTRLSGPAGRVLKQLLSGIAR